MSSLREEIHLPRPLHTNISAQLVALVVAALVVAALTLMTGTASAQTGVLMGSAQKTNWEDESAPCPKSHNSFCADEI